MSRAIQEREALIELLESTLGSVVQIVTTDAAAARPVPKKVAVLVEPPHYEFPTWNAQPVITWTLDIIAGTMSTQDSAFELIAQAIETLDSHHLNIASAEPVSFTIGTSGTLAAYQLILNPLELEKE